MIEISNENNNPLVRRGRVEYIDFLRVISTFAVVLLHIASQNLRSSGVHSLSWHIFNIADAGTRWAVPVFVMISGALFLGREQKIEKLYKKNIFRIFTCLIFWSAFYAVVAFLTDHKAAAAFKQFITGKTHLWFLFMIIGLYIIVPFLNKIVESKELTRYYLLIFFVVAVLLQQFIAIMPYFSTYLSSAFKTAFSNMKFNFALGYSGYFILGYYLKNTRISRKAEKIIYFLGLFGMAATILGTIAVSHSKGKTNTLLYTDFGLNVLLMAVAVFVFGKMRFSKIKLTDRSKAVIGKLSKYSFGIYLVHYFVMDMLKNCLHFTTLSFNAVLSVPVLFLLISGISLLISAVINRIPFLNKYII